MKSYKDKMKDYRDCKKIGYETKTRTYTDRETHTFKVYDFSACHYCKQKNCRGKIEFKAEKEFNELLSRLVEKHLL